MNFNIQIRPEARSDYSAVFKIITEAFASVPISDHQEQYLVERLRKNSEAYIPELSLVATIENKILGHIILYKIAVVSNENSHPSLALAPVSVLPSYQNQGIGGLLIQAAHEKAIQKGFTSIMLIGHEGYYPRFGYRKSEEFGIQFPFEVPSENAMAIELIPGSLDNVSGTIQYPEEFFMQTLLKTDTNTSIAFPYFEGRILIRNGSVYH